MNIEDYEEFCVMWVGTQETTAGGKVPSGAALAMVFEDLEEYPLEVIKQCVKRHRKTTRFAPTVFDIITMINESSGNKHLDADAAWAIVQESFDENKTVCMTKEMLEAKAEVQGLWDSGDYGTAKAFKSFYTMAINNAPAPVWRMLDGWDASQRAPAYEKAVKQGFITHERAKQLCVGYDRQQPDVSVNALLESANKRLPGTVTNNVIDFKTGIQGVKHILQSEAPAQKSRSELLKEHEALLREEHQKKLEQLKEIYPSEFVEVKQREEDIAS